MFKSSDRLSLKLAIFAVLLAFVVVTLGAYTRLKDAGLGCPDWPGCYGHYTVPQTAAQLQHAQNRFPNQPVEADKAWPEMIHRYVAGTFGLLVLALAIRAWLSRTTLAKQQMPRLPLILIGLVVFQALLGKWTVTMKLLPPVVMLHLLGGMSLVALTSLYAAQLSDSGQTSDKVVQKYRGWGYIGLAILIIQIALGGWTSANYAALVCHDFPYCMGKLIPPLDFYQAFGPATHSVGPDYQGGILSNTARATIQFTHRIGAIITFLYLGWLSLTLLIKAQSKIIRFISSCLLLTLIIQVSLGILNVVLQLPLPIAVAHNGIAALLLMLLVLLNYYLYSSARVQNSA